MTIHGAFREFPLSAGSEPFEIAAGPDGALWFTEFGRNMIGRVTTDGALTEFPVPMPNSDPDGIAAGPNALWFTEYLTGRIGRITIE